MNNFVEKIIGNSAVLATVSVVLAAGVMILMFFLFSESSEDPRPGAELVSEFAEGVEGLADGEIYLIPIRGIPAPFVSSDDGSVPGYVFLDVMLEVAGQEAHAATLAALEDLKTDFTDQISTAGVGMATRPGVVDYDRLAQVFLELAEAKVGQGSIARVVVQAALEEE